MNEEGLFSFLTQATAPEGSENYLAGSRYELIVFVREKSEELAKAVFRKALEASCWQFPEIQEIAKISGSMKLQKAKQLGLDEAMQTAVQTGYAIVVFQKP